MRKKMIYKKGDHSSGRRSFMRKKMIYIEDYSIRMTNELVEEGG
jgi:hypothetical protein